VAYAVELYFDAETEAAIREIWGRLAQAGLGDDLGALGFTPHISLGICENIDEQVFRDSLEQFASELLPLSVRFSSLGIFPGEVLFLAPVTDVALLKAHREFYKIYAPYAEEPSPFYQPGQWVPHCTLTLNLRPEERAGSLSAALETRLPILGRCARIGLSTFRPAASRYRFLLS